METPQGIKAESSGNMPTKASPPGENRRIAQVMLIASTVIFGLLFFPAAIGALTVPITANFRQRGMIEVIETYFLAWYFLSLPLVILGALAAAWVKYHQKAYRIAILLSLLPAAYIVFYLAVEFLLDGVLKG